MKKIEYDHTHKTYLEPEIDDVLNAANLGEDHTVEDWPWGRKQRCSMHFFVETHPKRGQRFVKQSSMNGRTYKPKKATYYNRVAIVEIDGKVGHVSWHAGYGMFGVNIEDGQYLQRTFHDDEAQRLAKHFGFI